MASMEMKEEELNKLASCSLHLREWSSTSDRKYPVKKMNSILKK